MALWKPFRGNRAGLDKVEKHDGYVYFCVDDGSLFFDYTDADGNLHRKQINAKDAETLLGHSIEEFLTVSENGSFAHGEGSVAAGANSYAGGQEALAFGNAAHVEGKGARAGDYSVEILGQQVSLTTLNLTIASADATNRTVTTSTTVIPKDNLTSLLSQLSTGRLVLKLAPSGTENYVYLPVDGYTIEVKDSILVDYSYLVLNVSDAYDETTNPALTSLVGYSLKDMCLGVAYGEAAHIEGYGNITYADYAHVEGKLTVAEGEASHTEGTRTIASGEAAHAEGASTRALGNYSHAEGHGAKATADDSHAEGVGAIASGVGSHAEGYYTEASYEYAHAEGRAAVASGKISHAEGHATVAFGSVSHAEGNGTAANGNNSHAEGHSTVAEGETSHAEGVGTKAQGKGSHAEGENTTAAANRAHAEGYGTSANELNSHAEGKLTTAGAEEAHAEGISTVASGAYSHAEGEITQALSEAAHAEGKETVAQGIGAHAEGSKSKALNNMAHAEGSNTEASGEKSHSEGNSTKATGTASHAEGDKTEAKGYASHAGGQNSVASNAASFVHGSGLKTNSNNQFVVGAYNKTYDQAAAFIVGNGKEDARSNALAVMKDGTTYVKGNLYVGGTPEGDEGTGIVPVATQEDVFRSTDGVRIELKKSIDALSEEVSDLGNQFNENMSSFGEELSTKANATDLDAKADKTDLESKADKEYIYNNAANAFKKTSSTTFTGDWITIDDLSPIPHMMHLSSKHSTSIEVDQYSKNLLKMESFIGGSLLKTAEETYDLRYTNGNSYVSAWNRQYLPGSTTITISLEIVEHINVSEGNLKLQIQTDLGNHWLSFPVNTIGRQSKTITTKSAVTQMQFLLDSSNDKTAGIVFKEPQFEFGSTMTEFVPYQKVTHIVTPEGIDIPAFYPITTLYSGYGSFNYTYNQDINCLAFMSEENPVGYGSFSMNRKAGTTVGKNSFAEGEDTTASGPSSHAEGRLSKATGMDSHAEGYNTTASYNQAHAEGASTIASGHASHTEGIGSTASAEASHAEGYYSQAKGTYSHAGGYYTVTNNPYAFAHGAFLQTSADAQAVFGKYNAEDPDALFIVGNGTSDKNRKNIFVVKKDGSVTGLNTSNALTNTASGEIVGLTDVSPVEHEMGVKARTKNLITNDYSMSRGGQLEVDGNSFTLTEVSGAVYFDFNLGDYQPFAGKTFTLSFLLDAMEAETNLRCRVALYYGLTSDSEKVTLFTKDFRRTSVGTKIEYTLTIPERDEYTKPLSLRFYPYDANAGDYVKISNIQLEEGSTATAYTPYIEDISAVKVKKTGKNILNLDVMLNSVLTKENDIYTITRLTNSHISGSNPLNIPANTFITLSGDMIEYTGEHSSWVRAEIKYANGTYSYMGLNKDPAHPTHHKETLVTKDRVINIRFYIESSNPEGSYSRFKNLMIELGSSATTYEPYIEPIVYSVSADGTVEGVTSLYPATTFIPDTAGVIVDCIYNKDINRILDSTGFLYDHNPVGTGSFSMNRKAGSDIGEYSFTEGFSAAASGRASHAGGNATKATKVGAFAHGNRVTADSEYQVTFGTYNEANENAAFIVGNGENNENKGNAFEVTKIGNVYTQGNLYIGGTGSQQIYAKQVATTEAVDTLNNRVEKVENIMFSNDGAFVQDTDIAYAKVIPTNVAPYASINKVGGLGTPYKNVVNLFPATYNIDNGEMSDYGEGGQYTFNADADGVITVTDTTPYYEFESEPWASADFTSMATVELAAGTYTISLESLDDWAPPFALHTDINGQSYTIGGYWESYDGAGETPCTFTLEENTVLTFDFGYSCGGSLYFPSGEGEYRYRIMLNKGTSGETWVAPSIGGNTDPYIEQPKVTSIDIYGKNLLDYGSARMLGGEFWPEDEEPSYWYYQAEVTANGMYYLNYLGVEAEFGPSASSGIEDWRIPIDGINTSIVYPAGTYSTSAAVPRVASNPEGDVLYLSLDIELLTSKTIISNVYGAGISINEPFRIAKAEIVYRPASIREPYFYAVNIPLTLVTGSIQPTEAMPISCHRISIPESIVSRDDYGLGVYRNKKLYNNYIDFDKQKYIINCLTIPLRTSEEYIDTHMTPIDIDLIGGETPTCSDPSLTCEIYGSGPATIAVIAYFEYPGDAEEYLQQSYQSGNPIKVFFGTTITQQVDISSELKNIDTQIPVEAGGLIVFNNKRKGAVPSEVEYQLNNQQGEIEEL